MGTMSQKIKDMQSKRIAYQKEKTKVEMQRIATYLTEEEREIFFSGKGFVLQDFFCIACCILSSLPSHIRLTGYGLKFIGIISMLSNFI